MATPASRNFLEILADPQNAEIDIVAIHGLNPFKNESNAFSTWTADNGKLWLRDEGFLPTQIPKARIMLFGYNSNVAFTSSNAGINEQAKTLLLRLDLKRQANPRRPMIFICHSLGGLLAKRALVIARNIGDERNNDIYNSVYGIVFFGTPHGGGNYVGAGKLAASIARGVLNRPKNSFLESLEKNDFFSEANHDDFLQRAEDFTFVSFYETIPTHGVMVVERAHAILGLRDAKEEKCAMDASHTDICKFREANGSDYEPVWQKLQIMVNNATKKRTDPSPVPRPDPELVQNQYFNIPIIENMNFQGRTVLMGRLRDRLFASLTTQRRVVLCGLGGIGKSALATHFAVEFRTEYEGVFWVSAESQTSLDRSYSSLDALVQSDFRTWCNDSRRRRWLLIIDNLDDLSVFNPNERIPTGRSGHIIVTSRRRDVASIGELLDVPPLEEEDATKLLLAVSTGRHETEHDESNANTIVKTLELIPLAICQCGAYVAANNDVLANYTSSLEKLLDRIEPPEMEDSDGFHWEASKTIVTTWEISYQRLLQTQPDAAALLTVFGFLDGSEISKQVLLDGFTAGRRWANDGNVVTEFFGGTPSFIRALREKYGGQGLNHAIGKLISYSLLFRSDQNTREETFYIHPFVHFWLSARRPDPNIDYFPEATFLLLNGYPNPDFRPVYGLSIAYSDLRREYAPHVGSLLLRYLPFHDKAGGIFDQPTLCGLATLFLWTSATDDHVLDYEKANFYNQCLRAFEEILPLVQYRPALWCQAALLHFEQHQAAATKRGADLLMTLGDLTYAGVTWASLRRWIEGRDPSGVDIATPLVTTQEPHRTEVDGTPINITRLTISRETEELLFPLPLEVIEGGSMNLVSGFLCLFGIKVVNSWHTMLGKVKRNVLPDGQAIYWLEARRGERFVGEWIRSLWPRVRSGNTTSSIEQYCLGILMSFEARIQILPDMPLLEKLQLAVNMTVPVMGTESVSGDTLTMRYLRTLEAESEIDQLEQICLSMLSLELTQYSFCIIVKVVPMLVGILKKRNRSLSDQEDFLKEILSGFLDASSYTRKFWAFYNDPVLNVMEFLIILLRDENAPLDTLEEWKHRYLIYFREHYAVPHLPYEMFLGFGIGPYGTSRGRLCLEFKPPTREAAEKGVLGSSEFFQTDDPSLGISGGSQLVPDPTVLGSVEEEDEALKESQEAYARFEDTRRKLYRFIYEESDTVASEALQKDEPVEAGLLRTMNPEDVSVESEKVIKAMRQSLRQMVVGGGDNEPVEAAVDDPFSAAESDEGDSTASKVTGKQRGEEEGPQPLSRPRQRLRDRLRERMGRYI